MHEEGQYRLIVGLGNPGKEYENTRHNIGFMALQLFAKLHDFKFRYSSGVKGDLAIGTVGGQKVLLLLPSVYMNLSGISVKLCQSYYKVEISHLIVVCDDAAIDFGECRLRTKGSSGGHNGLKNIEAAIGSQEYARLRVGIGYPTGEMLADYVLDKFTKEEQERLPEILTKVADMLKSWAAGDLKQGITI